MAKRKIQNQIKEVDKLKKTKEQFSNEIEKRIKLGEEIYKRVINDYSSLSESKEDFSSWDNYNKELIKRSFNNPNNDYHSEYCASTGIFFGRIGSSPSFLEVVKEHKGEVDKRIKRLKNIHQKIELMELDDSILIAPLSNNITDQHTYKNSKKVFIVHGHNNDLKQEVARTIEKLGLEPIILHEQPNKGRTVIEKFEKHSEVGFAIVLLTKDDLGKANSEEELTSRARQNVILELGFFIGKLSRERVVPLYESGVELPSDLSGVVYVPADPNGNWKFAIVKELKAVNYDVDANKIL